MSSRIPVPTEMPARKRNVNTRSRDLNETPVSTAAAASSEDDPPLQALPFFDEDEFPPLTASKYDLPTPVREPQVVRSEKPVRSWLVILSVIFFIACLFGLVAFILFLSLGA